MKLLFSILLFFIASPAFADGASTAWNSPWGFMNPAEKANHLNQAYAIEFLESGGYNSTSNFYQQQFCKIDGSCISNYNTANSIGTNINISGNNNHALGLNKGNASAQNNNGKGKIENNHHEHLDPPNDPPNDPPYAPDEGGQEN